MGWAGREIGIAAGVGVAVAAAWCVPAGIGGLTLVALVVGGVVGLVVGAMSVLGGAVGAGVAAAVGAQLAAQIRHLFGGCGVPAVRRGVHLGCAGVGDPRRTARVGRSLVPAHLG